MPLIAFAIHTKYPLALFDQSKEERIRPLTTEELDKETWADV